MLVIGVAGASASGKSLFAKTLCDNINEDERSSLKCVVISLDSYYHDQSHLDEKERDKINYDEPSAFDFALLKQHLTQLKQGGGIQLPIYDYQHHCRKEKTTFIDAVDVLIIEGILLFTDSTVVAELDLKAFIDTPLDVCLARRLRRDVSVRGRQMDSVLTQWEESVRPMYYAYVKPTREMADMMVPRGFKNGIALDVIKARVQIMLKNI
jgi:uridine kinase